MPTFDLAEVRSFAADLGARMERCENGEGMECAHLDGALRQYAVLCCEFCERVREWGRATARALSGILSMRPLSLLYTVFVTTCCS